jgi:hypothetical protein
MCQQRVWAPLESSYASWAAETGSEPPPAPNTVDVPVASCYIARWGWWWWKAHIRGARSDADAGTSGDGENSSGTEFPSALAGDDVWFGQILSKRVVTDWKDSKPSLANLARRDDQIGIVLDNASHE